MANFFSAFSLPYKFPSRNKKENAAEITFVLKASPLPLLPSSIFRACSLIIEAERKKEGKRKAQVDNETDSSRVARSSSNRTAQQRLFDNTRDGRGDVSGRLSICPFNSPVAQTCHAYYIASSPALSSLLPPVLYYIHAPRRLHTHIHIQREHRARGKYAHKFLRIFRTQRRRASSIRERNGFPPRVTASLGQIERGNRDASSLFHARMDDRNSGNQHFLIIRKGLPEGRSKNILFNSSALQED